MHPRSRTQYHLSAQGVSRGGLVTKKIISFTLTFVQIGRSMGSVDLRASSPGRHGSENRVAYCRCRFTPPRRLQRKGHAYIHTGESRVERRCGCSSERDVVIIRPSQRGRPFKIGAEHHRHAVVRMFRKWVKGSARREDAVLIDALRRTNLRCFNPGPARVMVTCRSNW